jgi:beta-phosphoglucomutase
LLNKTTPLTEKFNGCIFDFDGVIVDSEPVHAEAKRITLEHFNIKYPYEIFNDFKGRPDVAFFDFVSEKLTADKIQPGYLLSYKNDVYLNLFNDVKLIDGIIPFLNVIRNYFSQIGMATSATKHDLSLMMNKYDLHKYFDFIVTGEDTSKHKPDPEPFLKAISNAGKKASDILIIEDSPNGIIAGKSAGCFVIGITTSFSNEELLSAGADLVVSNYLELAEKL